MFGKRVLAGVASAALVIVTCVACGSSSGGSGSGGSIDEAGTLRFAKTTLTDSLDPNLVKQPIAAWSFLTPVYDRLVALEPGPKIVPSVATSWSFSSDSRTLTMKLRPDVTFHDGAKLTAAVAKASIERAKNLPGSTQASSLSMVSSVDAPDDSTIVFHTTRPAADLLAALASPGASMISPNHVGDSDLSQTDAGSGPFKLVQFKRGDRVIYERNDAYWNRAAIHVGRLEMLGLTDDNARLNAFRSGQVDVMQVQAGQVPATRNAAKSLDATVYVSPARAWYSFKFNIGLAPTDNPKVRQALNYAIDREALNQALLGGVCAPTSQPLQRGFDGFDPDSNYTYDPAKAKQLLTEAGFGGGLTISVAVGSGLQPHNSLTTALQDQLGKIGVKVDIHQADPLRFALDFANGQSNALILAQTPEVTQSVTLVNNYLSKARFPTPPPADFTNLVNATLNPSLPPAEVSTKLQQASRLASSEAFDLFVCAAPYVWASTSKISGIDSMPGIDNGTTIEPQYLVKHK